MADHLVRREIKERKATIDAELQELWQRIYRVEARQDQDWRKQEHYCREQREVLRALEDLTCKEREMYELDNRKDQVMTVCKVALVNLVMWTRDQYFPLTYAHATWKRLAPFFRLPGRVTLEPRTVSVELRPFNDRHLNHDLVALCERVNQNSPQLPDGRQLLFSVCPLSDRQRRRQDCALASASRELDRDSQRCYTPADICKLPSSFGGRLTPWCVWNGLLRHISNAGSKRIESSCGNHMLGLAFNLCDAPGLGLPFPFTNGGVVYFFR